LIWEILLEGFWSGNIVAQVVPVLVPLYK